jgi:protein dithiol oxidoreductase (disulfide-forming)
VKFMNLKIVLALAAIVVVAGIGFYIAGSNEEPPAVVDPAAAVQEVPLDEPEDTGESGEEPAGEAVEVVEESAADPGEEADERILLAQAGTGEPAGDFKYKEGTHYARLVPSQPTVGGADKIEVAEFFWYGCPHCFDLEPTINQWAEKAPTTVRFVRVPAMWNELLTTHARLYYTGEVLGRNEKLKDPEAFHTAVFEEYHQRGNRLLNEAAIQRLFDRFGVSEADFTKTWSSFEVAQKMRVAEDLARRYGISSVPTIVVNGKYRTGAAEAGSYEKLMEVIDELVARESTR